MTDQPLPHGMPARLLESALATTLGAPPLVSTRTCSGVSGPRWHPPDSSQSDSSLASLVHSLVPALLPSESWWPIVGPKGPP
jgi:hypothetical protein